VGDRATMMAALQKFGQQGGQGQPGANMPPSLPPMAGGQMPRTGGGEQMMAQPAAQGASVPQQQGPLQAQTVLQALNAGARPRATGRGYGLRT
jgi:hypothetical protein